MSSFARSRQTPRKKVEKDIDQFIKKVDLESIINDVYKYIEYNNTKIRVKNRN